MRQLDSGVHRLPARPLLLESSNCLVSAAVAVSHLQDFPGMHLESDAVDVMTSTPCGQVDTMAVPPEAAVAERRLREHVARIYRLGNGECLSDEDAPSQVLWCTGAAFHEDAVFNSVLAVALWHGADRDLVLPHLDVVVPMRRGTVVLFDSAQPHGLLKPGKRLFSAADFGGEPDRSVFCTLDLPRDLAGLCSLMQYVVEPRHVGRDVFRFGCDTGVNESTGAWMPRRYAIPG